MTEAIQEVAKWTKEVGINPPLTCPDSTYEDFAKISVEEINAMGMQQLEDIWMKLLSYSFYLKSLRSSLDAQIILAKSDLDRKLYVAVNNLPEEFRFKNINEKIAIVRESDVAIESLVANLNKLQAKFVRIKDIPFAIDKVVDLLKNKYMRLSNEQRALQSASRS